MTDDLIALKEFIKAKGCSVVAMESTGSYWKPIYNLLELESIKIILFKAKHIKNVTLTATIFRISRLKGKEIDVIATVNLRFNSL
jgi:transposase